MKKKNGMYCLFCDEKMYGVTFIVQCKVNKKILIHTTLLSWVEFFQKFNI